MVISIILVVLAFCLLWVLISKYKAIFMYIKISKSKADLYSIIIFICVSVSSLVLIIYGSFKNVDNSIILNFILLTITSITIAIFLDRVGFMSEIVQKIDGINGSNEKMHSRREVERNYPLRERLKDSKDVYIITTTAASLFLGASKEIIDEAIENGTKFTLITLNPKSEAWREYLANKMFNTGDANKSAADSVPDTIKKNYHDKINYLQTNINIPYALMYVIKNRDFESFIKIDLYSIGVQEGERPCLMIYQNNPYFDFFRRQVDIIIKKSNSVTSIKN